MLTTAREQHVYHAATCFEVAIVTTMDSQEPACAVMMATCWLLNEHAAYLIRRFLEALNSTEDGTTTVWQLDAPLHHFAALIYKLFEIYIGHSLC